MRWVVAVTGVAVLPSVVPTSREQHHPSGIALLTPQDLPRLFAGYDRAGASVLEPLRAAYSDVRQLAEQHPDALGVPWIDIANRRLEVRIASPDGERLVHATTAPQHHVATTRSFGLLREIMDGSIDDPALGLRGGTARVWTIGIDDESQRVVFETDRVNDAFVYALAKRYGTEAVAVRVDPRAVPGNPAIQLVQPPATAVRLNPDARRRRTSG